MRYKTLRVISVWTIGIPAFIAFSFFLAQRYLGPEVKRLFIAEINKSLTAEVQIDDVQLSLFKDFPFAAVRFSGVRMKEAKSPPSKYYLLTAGNIALRFNIWDLLRKQYSIKTIRLDNVEIAPHVYADGTDNFHFWKPVAGAQSTDFNFGLQRIVVANLHVKYINDESMVFIDADFPGFTAKGDFKSSRYALVLSGNMLLHDFKMQGTSYVKNRIFDMRFNLDADNTTGLYTVSEGRIETGKLKLTVAGNLIYSGKQRRIDLDATAAGPTLEEMMSLVPVRYTEALEGYVFEGKGSITSKISGFFGGNHTPGFNVSLDMQHGTVAERKSGIRLENVSARIVYNVNQDGADATLSIGNLKARLGAGSLGGSLMIRGFSAPFIRCNLSANLNLDELQKFLKYDKFTFMKGWLKMNVSFDGQIADISDPRANDFLNSSITGSGSLLKAGLGLKNYELPLTDIQSAFEFNGNDLQLKQLVFRAGQSDFNLRGTLGNLFSWIFVKDESLFITGSLASQRFNWDELSTAQQGSVSGYQFSLPADISVSSLQLQTGNFTFGKFSAHSITGLAQMHGKVLSVGNIHMQTCQGEVTGQFNINAKAAEHSLLQAKAHLEKVNIKTLFTQFGNFGQDDLKDENLEGLLTSDVVFSGFMHSNLDIDLNSVKTHADIRIDNGRLVNFSPMQSLSSFLKVEDLADIRFATFQNQVDIANQVIYIPSMEIKSSALDLQLMGTHTFDNDLDYHFTIALADLLANKFKRRNQGFDQQAEFGPVQDDGRGRTKIYVSLTGTVENPIVKYDKKAMRAKIANDMKAQKTELKQIIRQEFSRVQGDTLKKAQQSKDKEILKKQEQGKFVIEWDDDKKVE